MRRLIAAINMTVDGFCDHTAAVADDELHQHYNDLFKDADTILFGRTTYQLMEDFWPAVVQNPTGDRPIDEFGVLIGNISKVVFSRTLNGVSWKNARLATRDIREEVLDLKRQEGRNILAGSPSLIVQLTQLGLVDEYQLCVHPIILGSGLRLFRDIKDRIDLRLIKSEALGSGAVILYYEPIR